MKTNRIRLTESQLHNVIKESVKRVLNEQMSDLKEPYYKLNNAINDFVDVLESNYVNSELVQKLKTIQDDVTDFCRHPDMGGNRTYQGSVPFGTLSCIPTEARFINNTNITLDGLFSSC